MEKSPPIYVRGDKDMLIRIVDNLLNNCSKHSLGDIDIKIDYDKIPDSKNAKIIFTNPISQNSDINVEKLFHRFYTTDSTRNKSTGLGLSIVEFLVKQLNGDVGAYLDKNTKYSLFILKFHFINKFQKLNIILINNKFLDIIYI